MAQDLKNLIEVKGLTYQFGEAELANKVLDNIDIIVPRGKIIILTGPSGSGKTTLLTIMGSLRRARTGSVKILGKEIIGASNDLELEIRKDIGFVFQSHNLLPALNARQNVAMSLELYNDLTDEVRLKKSDEMLAKIGMGERVNYYPDDLSGGQCQRVAIARALVGNPKLILADEPTASLDSASGQAVLEFLRELCDKKGCSVLVVTHDPRISHFADHIVNLEDGQITSGHIKVD